VNFIQSFPATIIEAAQDRPFALAAAVLFTAALVIMSVRVWRDFQ
jgi:hypothetical protein